MMLGSRFEHNDFVLNQSIAIDDFSDFAGQCNQRTVSYFDVGTEPSKYFEQALQYSNKVSMPSSLNDFISEPWILLDVSAR